MKTLSQRGSVLITTLVFVTIMIVGVAAVLELSIGSMKLSERNELRARARAVAESELENLYSRFSAEIVRGTSPGEVPNQLADIADSGSTPTTNRTPFVASHVSQNDGWIVRRSVETDMNSVAGQIPGSGKYGKFSYYTIKVEVIPAISNNPTNVTLSKATAGMGQNIVTSATGGVAVRVGRHFSNSESSVFQYSIFFQGDLELAPGTNTTIDGDIAANGSIFMGAAGGNTLTVSSGRKINYLKNDYFNSAPTYDASGNIVTDALGNVVTTPTYKKPGTYNTTTHTVVTTDTTLSPPVRPDGSVIDSSSNDYLNVMDEPANLLGGLDAPTIATDRNDLFGSTATPADAAIAENNVFHAQITPPPSAAAPGEYPAGVTTSTADDPRVGAIRAYNRASLIVTVNADNSITFSQVTSPGTDGRTEVTVPATAYAGVVSQVLPTSATPLYDSREGKNITLTEIDVGALITQLAASYPTDTTGSGTGFNGMVYVNLKNGSSANPAAVRIKNAASTPNTNGLGFSVVTNGGMYVQGDFNKNHQTITNTDGTTSSIVNPAMLMADAVTILSNSWTDATSTADIHTGRIPSSANSNLTVNAGILTGNVAATATAGSGGAQNLVRFLENWSSAGGIVNFFGSSGRLFDSTRFTAPFLTGQAAMDSNIYQPPSRTYSFNSDLQKKSPPGSPKVSKFSRGNFFTW